MSLNMYNFNTGYHNKFERNLNLSCFYSTLTQSPFNSLPRSKCTNILPAPLSLSPKVVSSSFSSLSLSLSPPPLPPSQQPPAADSQKQNFHQNSGNKTGKCKWKLAVDHGGTLRVPKVGSWLHVGPKILVLPCLLVLLSLSKHGS